MVFRKIIRSDGLLHSFEAKLSLRKLQNPNIPEVTLVIKSINFVSSVRRIQKLTRAIDCDSGILVFRYTNRILFHTGYALQFLVSSSPPEQHHQFVSGDANAKY